MTKSLSTTVDANRELRIRSLLLVLDEVLQACEIDLSVVLEESSKLSKPGELPTVEKIAKAAAYLKNFELHEDSNCLKHFGWEFARVVSIFKSFWIPEGIDEEEILFWKEEIDEFRVCLEDPEQSSEAKEKLRSECRNHAGELRRNVERIQTVLRQKCGFNPKDPGSASRLDPDTSAEDNCSEIPSLRALDSQIPDIEFANGDWISAKLTSEKLGVNIKTLSNHRNNGDKLQGEGEQCGCHDHYCFWRKIGNKHPWYHLPTMIKHAGHLGGFFPGNHLKPEESSLEDSESSPESPLDD